MRHAAQGDRWTSKPSGLRIIFRFGIRPLAGEVRDVDVNVDVDMDAGYGRCGTFGMDVRDVAMGGAGNVGDAAMGDRTDAWPIAV